MELLKQFWDKIQGFLSKLTTSQRLSFAALSAVIVISFIWMLYFLMQDPYASLIPASASAETRQKTIEQLDLKGIKYEITMQNEVLIPRSQLVKFKTSLLSSGIATKEQKDNWEWLFNQTAIGDTSMRTNQKKDLSIRNDLKAMIETLDFVQEAKVVIDFENTPSLLRIQDPSKATVTVRPASGRELGQLEAETIANIVSFGVANLEPNFVSVVDARDAKNSYQGRPRNDPAQILNRRAREEKNKSEELKQSLYNLLCAYKSDLSISVTPHYNWDTGTEESRTPNSKDEPIKMSVSTSTHEAENATTGGDAGTNPNIGTTINTGPNNKQREKSATSVENNDYGTTNTKTTREARMDSVSAAITYYYDQTLLDPKDPDYQNKKTAQDALDAQRQALLKKIETLALTTLGRGHPGLSVTVAVEAAPRPPAPIAPTPSISEIITSLLERFSGTIVLMVMGLVVLWMLHEILKRVLPKPPEEPGDLAWEDEEEEEDHEGEIERLFSMRADNIRKQIKNVIDENPKIAKNLIQKWVMKEE